MVARSEPGRGIGMPRRADIVRAYSNAMLDRIESQTHRPIVPRDLRGTRVVEVPVGFSSVLAGQTLSHLQLPRNMLVVAIQRESETIIPRGDTQLAESDCLQILVHDNAIASLHEHLASLTGPR